MNILVTGANGQLGMELRSLSENSGLNFLFTDIVSPDPSGILDITDADAVMRYVTENHIEIIVNCAAYTNVERAEDEPEASYAVNCTAAKNLAIVAQAVGATLIHISTDYVFSGRGKVFDSSSSDRLSQTNNVKGEENENPEAGCCSEMKVNVPYNETDGTGPLSVYGRTKLKGEKAIEKSGCKWLIFRTSGLYSPYGNNFVKTIRNLLREKDEISVVSDQICTPTYAADLAALIFRIIEDGLYDRIGLYHFSNEGQCSWYEFALAVAEFSGYSCKINPCTSAEYGAKAQRPAYSVLDKSKVKETFGVEIPAWRDSLAACISRLCRGSK